MAEQKKQNFLQGTALLAAATVIVKLVGALYKVPLNAIIGEKGFGYFSTAYEIYNILLMISTAGLPVAMSRMISQASSLEHYGQVRQVLDVNKAQRHIRGGIATREKYLQKAEEPFSL